MIAACPSHVKNPPASDSKRANALARVLTRHNPSLIPELMWDTSYPEGTACCARGALAYSLVHAAIRRMLNEGNTE